MNSNNGSNRNIMEIGNHHYRSSAKDTRVNSDKPMKLAKIILYYKRNEYLVGLKFIYQLVSQFGSKDDSTFKHTEPEIFGPLDKNYNKKEIDEIEISFEKDEEIYAIKGKVDKSRIVYLSINTIFGQYVEFGKVGQNFQWEFYYNLLLIDGFKISWDEYSINYLSCITSHIQSFNEEKRNRALSEVNDLVIKTAEPMYQSEQFGVVSDDMTFIDDLLYLDFIDLIKEGKVYLSSISVYCEEKRITRIDTEYTNKSTRNFRICQHKSSEYDDKNKKMIIHIPENDYVNQFSVTYGKNYLRSVYFKTHLGRELECKIGEDKNKVEFCEKEKSERDYKLLGLIVGKANYIRTIQYYYERIINNK